MQNHEDSRHGPILEGVLFSNNDFNGLLCASKCDLSFQCDFTTGNHENSFLTSMPMAAPEIKSVNSKK